MESKRYSNIPDNWAIKKFGDIAKITCGVAATPEYVDKSIGVPFFSASNVQKGKLKLKKIKYIPVELHKKLTKNTKPEKGDVLMTRVGAGIGEAAVVDVDYEYSVYVSLTLIKCGEMLDSHFVKSVLNSDYYRYLAFREQFGGGGVPNLNVQMVKDYVLAVPPLPEQRKIAQILSTWDRGIATTEKLIDASKQQKKALMQQLLTGKKRLVDPETGKAFEGEWEEVKLGEILKIGSGKDYKHLEQGNVPVYGTGGYMLSVSDYLYDGDSVCIGRKGTIDKPMLLSGKFWTVDTLFFTHSFNQTTPQFIYQYFLTINWKKYSEASGVPSLSKSIIEKISIKIPILEEQQKIASVLTAADKEIDLLKAKLAHFKQEKKALMQQLLTGKRRVSLSS